MPAIADVFYVADAPYGYGEVDTMSKNKTDYVRVASYIFTEEYRNQYGSDATGILFNKCLTLLHRQLKSEGYDIRLPHCWYRWGDEVVRYYVPYIQWTHDDLMKTTVSYRGPAPHINYKDDLVRRSEDYILEFINEHGEYREGMETAVDEVYSGAPFEFQKNYRELRESLQTSLNQVGFDNFEQYVMGLFESAMGSFPREFKSLSDQKDRFSSVFREAAVNGASGGDLFDLAETFWFYFCYHLRLNNRCHENITRETLNIWREMLPERENDFEISIQNYAAQLCSPNTSNPVVLGLLSSREERLSELREILSELEG